MSVNSGASQSALGISHASKNNNASKYVKKTQGIASYKKDAMKLIF